MGVRIVIRGTAGRLRSAMSFGTSGMIHAFLLAWLITAASMQHAEPPRSIYDQEIRPYEKHIVWYNLRDKLPNIRPSAEPADKRPPRARLKFNQSIVAGDKDDARPPQVIRMPAPAIELPKPLALPNVLAVAAPRPVRTFVPPPVREATPKPALVLPEAPQLAPDLKSKPVELAAGTPKPLRPFTAPAAAKPAKAAPVLPNAPELQTDLQTKAMNLAGTAARPTRAFTSPDAPRRPTERTGALALPEAPRLTAPAESAVTLPIAVPVAGPRRAFTAPAGQARLGNMEAALPDAPALGGPAVPAAAALPITAGVAGPRRSFSAPPGMARHNSGSLPGLPEAPQIQAVVPPGGAMPRIPRGFTPPPSRSAGSGESRPAAPPLPEAPGMTGATPTPGAAETLAIVGLHPANTTEVPRPPGSHEAGFSAGPKPGATGAGAGPNHSASIVIPGLLTHGGTTDNQPTLVSVLAPPTSRENLVAALHGSTPSASSRTSPGEPRATRVESAPDPRLIGRMIYTLAIQMPNVTSYSGSWIVWFAEHAPASATAPLEMRPPIPTRKVDPKYIQAAADERVEGTVRLAAIIRKDGHVEHIELLKHLDERLDRSASEALGKWEFEPARRDGAPIDIDAVFEIPFRLAPKLKK